MVSLCLTTISLLTYCILFCYVRLQGFPHLHLTYFLDTKNPQFSFLSAAFHSILDPSIDTFSFHPTSVYLCSLHFTVQHLSISLLPPKPPTQRWTWP